MMKIIIVLVALLAICLAKRPHAHTLTGDEPALTDRLIEHINAKDRNWRAGSQEGTFIQGATLRQVRAMLGTRLGGPKLPRKADEVKAVPTTFDARTNWPNCPTMTQIRDQSACGSCWAFGAAEAMSDRMCVSLNKTVAVSAADVAFCCGFSCGDGCGGGYPGQAWSYWVSKGVVTETCDPYPFPSCDHHIPNSPHPCPSNEYPNPPCPDACKDSESWSSAKHFGASAYSVDGIANIQTEIMTNGPVEAAFSVYADFLTYKSGVYKHVSGGFLGGHAVKILGWGNEGGEDYWLVANSWNPTWGDHGYFKILKGADECGIEDGIVAGMPKN